MTRRRHTPEQIIRKLAEGQKLLAGGALLNGWQFDSLLEARALIEDWRVDYNTNRPHSSLHGLTPTEFATSPTTQPQHA